MANPPPLIRLLHSHRIAWFGLLLLVAAAGLFLALAKHKNTEMESLVFESLIKSTAERIEGEFSAFFTPVVDNLDIIRRWGEKDSIALDEPLEFNKRFIPILEQYPQISALILANAAGNEYFLLRKGSLWLTRLTRPGDWGNRVQWSRWKTASDLDEQWWEENNYDPRSRPWFKGAMKLEKPGARFWTHPYTFFTLQEPGITVAVRTSPTPAPDAAADSTPATSMVIGFDVLLANIARSTTATSIGNNGKVFALTADNRILGPPKDPRFDHDPGALKKSILTPASALDIHELNIALETWNKAGEPLGQAFKFKVNRDVWWGVFRGFPLGERGFRIGYIVPQKDFTDELGSSDALFFWAGAGLTGIALLAFLLSFAVLRRSPWEVDIDNSQEPVDDSPATSKRVRQLIAHGENEHAEFKSTLRWNLNTDKPGKEVEMSWLKTVVAFLNSNGGDLLVGVDDDGKVLGIDADRFPSEDKYLLHVNNLINQHIGTERAPYIRFSLVSIAEHKVLLVNCTPAKTATFLTIGKQEEFYIRSGPGSRKLPPSKVVAYMADRNG